MYVYKSCAVDIDLLLITLSNEEQLKSAQFHELFDVAFCKICVHFEGCLKREYWSICRNSTYS
jgi:hypothetical protein